MAADSYLNLSRNFVVTMLTPSETHSRPPSIVFFDSAHGTSFVKARTGT